MDDLSPFEERQMQSRRRRTLQQYVGLPVSLSLFQAVLPPVAAPPRIPPYSHTVSDDPARTPQLENLPSPLSYAITDLGTLKGRKSSTANAINERGQVVGASGHGFLWEKGRMTDLGAIPSPAENTESKAFGINRKGQVVGSMGGYFLLSMTGLHEAGAFLWEDGQIHQLGGKKDWSTFEAFDINDRGWVVGSDGYRGFLWRYGRFKTIYPLSKRPSGNATKATAINSRGQIAGGTTVYQAHKGDSWAGGGGGTVVHAFFWQNGKMKDLGTLDPLKDSVATDLNEKGQVVGDAGETATWQSCSVYGITRAFLWDRGRMKPLPMLSDSEKSQAHALNNHGEIVGRSGERAVLWRNGQVFDLNGALPKDSGWTLVEANDINDKGQIVGAGRKNGNPELQAFLLTPLSK